MFCLRMLGQVELELNGFSAAQELIKEMMQFDPAILTKDEEALALQYRVFADQGSWVDAMGLLDKAADLAAKSYYLANLRALATMKVDGLSSALPRFKEVLSIVEKSGDRSVYARGTAVNAYLAVGDSKAAEQELTAVNDLNESKDKLGSISKYYNLISEERTKFDRDFDFQWSNVLRF
jgi:tetratricopeptide (TPR) repeat protein